MKQSVFITGCSSGIGYATTRLLLEKGWEVFASARKPDDLHQLKVIGATPVALDMTDEASVEEAAAFVLEKSKGSLTGLVNNAGYGQPGALEDLDRETMRKQFEVNVIGLQQLTNAFIPTFIEKREGRIVNVSSVVGQIALPILGVYSASKFALEALSDALRIELAHTGVNVSIIEPGPIKTAFRPRAISEFSSEALKHSRFRGIYKKEMDSDRASPGPEIFAQPPEAVAKKIAHALSARNPKKRYKVTLPAHLGYFVRKWVPTAVVDHILTRSIQMD